MTDQQEELRCIGCGSVIQTTDQQGLGYTPQSALERGLASGVILPTVFSLAPLQ